MSNYARYRDLHLWVGLLLLVPTTVIAVTGVLWNHEKTLGLRADAQTPMPESASHRAPTTAAEPTPPLLSAAPGTWRAHAEAIDAALAAGQDAWGTAVPLERIELKQEPGLGLVVKVKAPEEAGMVPQELIWSVAAGQVVEWKGDPTRGTDWAKLVHDLHTGKFFSRRLGFLWSDAAAAAILFLGATGVILYLWPLLKKRSKRQQLQTGTPPVEAQTPLALIRAGGPAPRSVQEVQG